MQSCTHTPRTEQDVSLVPTGVDRADVLEAEVPFEVRLQKGCHKATAGSIHVDLHIIPL